MDDAGVGGVVGRVSPGGYSVTARSAGVLPISDVVAGSLNIPYLEGRVSALGLFLNYCGGRGLGWDEVLLGNDVSCMVFTGCVLKEYCGGR